MDVKKISMTCIVLAAFAVVLLAGCQTELVSDNGGNFNSKGLPSSKYFVGGGLEIVWDAPEDGTAYLVEETTSKFIMTKSLEEDEKFDFSPGSVGPDEAKSVFGVEMAKLKFSLYFIPATEDSNP